MNGASDAVAWAAPEELLTGYDDGSGLFGPGDALTREQAAVVLMRWAASKGAGVCPERTCRATPIPRRSPSGRRRACPGLWPRASSPAWSSLMGRAFSM